MKTWVTRELAEYASGTTYEDYPRAVVERVKILLLDSLGCMLGGCQTDLGNAMVTPIKSMGGSEESTIVGGGARVPTIQAAFGWACTQELYGPADLVDAQFCIPYTVTMVLMGIHPGPEWYTPERLRSEHVLDASRKVRIKIDPVLDKAYFEKNQLSARVEIQTKQGQRFEAFVDVPRGDPRKPLSSQEIEDKFRNQAAYALPEEEIDRVIDSVYGFENILDISNLMAHLSG